jgi:predicted negative regulator of RcsB-dependent stress response
VEPALIYEVYTAVAFCLVLPSLRSTRAMPIPASPPNPNSAGAPGAARVEVPVDEQLKQFWQKNSNLIVVICFLFFLSVLGKGVWDYMAGQRELTLRQDFAAASATPEKLLAFAMAHPDDTLGGVARLKLADDAYASGRIGEALAGYEKAGEVIKSGPLAARIQLGLAITKIQAGQVSEGEANLRQILGDASQSNSVRAEAGYDLASCAASSGRSADVEKIAEQIMQIDPSSPWAQRAFVLSSTLPQPSAAGAAGTR